MSDLGFMDKLLNGAEVVWKPLAEIAIIGTGSRNTNEATNDGKFPFFVRSQMPRSINEYEFDETAIITAGDGVGVGKVFHYMSGKYALHQRAYRIVVTKNHISPKYLFHYIRSNFAQYLKQISVHASVTSLRKPMFEKYPVPIPCPDDPEKSLNIQAEIVRILDAFTEITAELRAELRAELTMRKKQYDHYRDQLFTFDKNDVPQLPMGHSDIGTFIRGSALQKKDFTEKGVGCIHYGQVYTHYGTYTYETKSFISESFAMKARKAKAGDLIIATTSETDEDVCKAVAWLGPDQIVVSSDACFYTHNLNPKYVAYFFQTEQFQKQKRQYITGTKIRRVNADNLAKILIPVPSKKEQTRIVSILDKFDTLTDVIQEELLGEIELRQKQYEHYRDLLLRFPKPEEVAA
ncbi:MULTISPECIES: restriction endonuclease subunit S [Thalassospira]|uniref:restriction endonuclease subunit S n=1 Tax=Thalassospira TaxID=168934 RepID=UPI0008DD7D1D|nr:MULTISPECIES: restriction endonuclease subunit S [Thalassospira]MDM7976271.1 restriction endonuclease subunit S [Thalassospira xiamenensis]OHY97738.1 type I restriction endonuclease subunit S [Thalassospira sp. MIT1004]